MQVGKILTIVVPVYKVEHYIDKCLSSLILEDSALMDTLEVIVVNDGTPDNSAEMSREYVKRYPGTFRQIDKENGGHGSAWNVGLEEATGKYLRFLDSDDWFTNLDKLLLDLRGCDADIVLNPYNKIFASENRIEERRHPVKPRIVSLIMASEWGIADDGLNRVNFWGVTYKTRILKPLVPLFAEKVMFDDYILSWASLIYGRSFVSFDYVVYNYLLGRPGQSMSATQQRKGALSYAKCFDQFEAVRSRIDERAIPSELLTCIDKAIVVYAGHVLSKMIYLPLKDALDKMAYLWEKYLADTPNKSHLLKRYAVMPGVVFYYVEHLRRMIKRI